MSEGSCVEGTAFEVGAGGDTVVGGMGAMIVLAAFVSLDSFEGCRAFGAGSSVAGAVGDGTVVEVEIIGADVATAVGTATDGKIEGLGVWPTWTVGLALVWAPGTLASSLGSRTFGAFVVRGPFSARALARALVPSTCDATVGSVTVRAWE
jgi:hypothetical protein